MQQPSDAQQGDDDDAASPRERFLRADARFQRMLQSYQPTEAERHAMAATMNRAMISAAVGSAATPSTSG